MRIFIVSLIVIIGLVIGRNIEPISNYLGYTTNFNTYQCAYKDSLGIDYPHFIAKQKDNKFLVYLISFNIPNQKYIIYSPKIISTGELNRNFTKIKCPVNPEKMHFSQREDRDSYEVF